MTEATITNGEKRRAKIAAMTPEQLAGREQKRQERNIRRKADKANHKAAAHPIPLATTTNAPKKCYVERAGDNYRNHVELYKPLDTLKPHAKKPKAKAYEF